MKTKAIISIKSSQGQSDEEPISIVTPGTFYERNNTFYAVYEETEISGMKGTTTTIKIRPSEFLLLRTGTTNARMHFRKNDKNASMYDTPYGTLQLEIETTELNINVNEEGGNIYVNYDMTVSGQKVMPTFLEIDIKIVE
jgi:uncharacterized beta-barrel protein YwiB (DUF1934 family)